MTRAARLAGLNRESLGVQPGHSVKVFEELGAVPFELGLWRLPLVRPSLRSFWSTCSARYNLQ